MRSPSLFFAAFDELAEDPWGMPTTIAADMHVWRFDEAEAAMGQARDVRADVDALAERAGALDQRLPDLEPAWLAGDFAGLSDRVARIDGVLDDLDTLRQRADAAGLPAPGVPVDVGSDDPDEMAARITAFGDAMDALEQAELELDRTGDDPVEVVGLAGSDPVTLRQSARTAIARGDVDGLAAATDAMAGLVDDADARGRLRLGGGALVVALLVGAAVVLLVRRRRRRRRPSVAASTDG